MRKYFLVTAAVVFNITVVKCQKTEQTADSAILKNLAASADTLPQKLVPYNWTMSDNHKRTTQFVKSLYISLPLVALGIMGTTSTKIINKYEIREERNEHFANFHTKVDNYLIFAPIAGVYALNALGVKGEHGIGKQSWLLLKSEAIMNAIVFPIKTWSHVERPDGKDNLSFPSGHTAQAFVSAEFLRKEYGREHPWIAVGGYAVATSVAALRMMNNRHWAPDVLAGAGIGILSVNLAYLTQNIKMPFNTKKIQLTPTYSGGGPGMYMCYHLGK